MGLFWSRDKVNREIRLFHEQVMSSPDVVVHSSQRTPLACLLYIPDLRRVSGSHILAEWTFLFVLWTHVTLV